MPENTEEINYTIPDIAIKDNDIRAMFDITFILDKYSSNELCSEGLEDFSKLTSTRAAKSYSHHLELFFYDFMALLLRLKGKGFDLENVGAEVVQHEAYLKLLEKIFGIEVHQGDTYEIAIKALEAAEKSSDCPSPHEAMDILEQATKAVNHAM